MIPLQNLGSFGIFNQTAPSRGGFPKALGAACPDPFSVRSDKVKGWELHQEPGLLGPAARVYLLSLALGSLHQPFDRQFLTQQTVSIWGRSTRSPKASVLECVQLTFSQHFRKFVSVILQSSFYNNVMMTMVLKMITDIYYILFLYFVYINLSKFYHNPMSQFIIVYHSLYIDGETDT